MTVLIPICFLSGFLSTEVAAMEENPSVFSIVPFSPDLFWLGKPFVSPIEGIPLEEGDVFDILVHLDLRPDGKPIREWAYHICYNPEKLEVSFVDPFHIDRTLLINAGPYWWDPTFEQGGLINAPPITFPYPTESITSNVGIYEMQIRFRAVRRIAGPILIRFNDSNGCTPRFQWLKADPVVYLSLGEGRPLVKASVQKRDLMLNCGPGANAQGWEAGWGNFLRGDSNGDGRVNIGDAVMILLQICGEREFICPDAADVNDDGIVDTTDPVFLLSYLFIMGELPPGPFPVAAEDLTEDELGCP